MSDKIIVKVASQLRGENAQEAFGFVASEATISLGWGLQPGTAVLTWVRAATDARVILPLAALDIEVGGHTFYGLCPEAVAVESHEGRSLTQQFVDTRYFLQSDVIYGQFNLPDARLVNGQYTRRFRHLLPANYNAHRITFTDTPYTARQIMDFCFAAQTVESPWGRWYATALNQPVLDVDCYGGRKLGTLLVELSARCGCDFTLQGGRYSLVWAVRGVGAVPTFPANATRRRTGLSVSENPTRLRILGERNQYQVLNLTLLPDWLPAWEAFFDLEHFADDLFLYESTEAAIAGVPAGTRYNAIPGDATQLVGRQLAQARAHVITVEEYAALREARDGTGDAYRDTRRAFGQSRLQMPVATYLRLLLFRAFRVPANFSFTNDQGENMPLAGLDLQERGLRTITHDPVTGAMSVAGDARMAGNGYAIVRGYNVGFDGFRTLRPGQFRLSEWVESQNLWQAVPFQVDDSGEDGKFVLFEEPVIRSADLLTDVFIDGAAQGYPALKRGPALAAPEVRAALVFAGERFSRVYGAGTRDDVENVPGLSGQFIVGPGGLTDLLYADGDTAEDKAAEIAANLLNRQYVIAAGGYEVQGSNATQLTAMISRVTVTLNAGSGLTEQVDFANERARNVGPNGAVQLEPTRDFTRREQVQPLFPGEREQREAANQLRLQAVALRQSPRMARTLLETFHLLMGQDAPPRTVFVEPPETPPAGETYLPVGTPVWREADERVVQPPTAPELSAPVLDGMTVFEGERLSGPIRVTAMGDHGRVLARVLGPVSVGDAVGYAPGESYLTAGGTPLAGNVEEAIAEAVVKYIPIRVTGAGGQNWRWADEAVYDLDTSYQREQIVFVPPDHTVVVSGHVDPDTEELVETPAGLWVCLRPPRVAIPDTDPVEYEVHAPQWPAPTPNDPDAEDNYWWPISFYPVCF